MPYGTPEVRVSRPICDRTGYETYLAERMRFDLWEFVLHVVGVHGTNLLASWRTQYLDDFHKLINARLSRE